MTNKNSIDPSMDLHGEESNYLVLEKVLMALKRGESTQLIEPLDAFLEPKRRPLTELEELTIKARGGDKEAACQIIKKYAELNDGP